ncbi:hypothetical protein ACFY7C_12605 [Streptomyces sp. NPDC012769]|uniref:hypothetical protein n=1 Tax=Streptomyces sp. NPDC012769 TaxID=3364848 RepID=UPI0036C3A6BE
MEGELRRLRSGPTAEDDRQQPFLVRVRFTAKDPDRVVADARTVLTRVVERTGDWPPFERWPRLLPECFVQRCAPEPGEPEPEPPVVGAGPWMLSDWLHCFDPTEEGAGEDRSWWWWDAGTDESGDGGWVQVATDGWPFGSGSLSWMIKACGGTDLAYGP